MELESAVYTFQTSNRTIQVGELLLFISSPNQTLVLTSSLGSVLKHCCLSVYSAHAKNDWATAALIIINPITTTTMFMLIICSYILCIILSRVSQRGVESYRTNTLFFQSSCPPTPFQ